MRGAQPCEHVSFTAAVQVDRIEDRGAFMANVQVRCAHCAVRFRWLGLKLGLSFSEPMVSVDEFELRGPIVPDAHTTMLMAGAETGYPVMAPKPRPEIICLCGSSRFIDQMAIFAWELEKGGKIVLSLHLLPASYPGIVSDHQAEAEGIAGQMDALHLRKIELADRVIVLNVGGYIGDSTRREIAYATEIGKPVSYLEPLA